MIALAGIHDAIDRRTQEGQARPGPKDCVGCVPMPSGGKHEAFVTTDYDDEMIGHIERHPEVRGRAVFVRLPEGIIPLSSEDPPEMRDRCVSARNPDVCRRTGRDLLWDTGTASGRSVARFFRLFGTIVS